MGYRRLMADEVLERRYIIEITPAAYKEIWDKLAEAGYDWLVFPDFGQIAMDVFVVRSSERRHAP